MNQSMCYTQYTLKLWEYLLITAGGFLIGGSIAHLFYEVPLLSILVGGLCAFGSIPLYKKKQIEHRKKLLTLQFREMLRALSASFGSGGNLYIAFRSAEQDMRSNPARNRFTIDELSRINWQLDAGRNIEEMLYDFADRSGIEDIQSFACVFDTCYRRGGNIRSVLQNTSNALGEKMDIEHEIEAVLSAKRSEQRMMFFMPPVFVLILRGIGDGLTDLSGFYGRVAMTFALLLFGLAYAIGRKITAIHI